LVERIDKTRHRRNLSSAIRLFVLEHFKMNGSGQSGHAAEP
jgi:predicted DNA-binding ribbon-helix-helix protein